MLIILTRSREDGHIPSPWAVGYSILGFLVFKDWQVDLHSETSPCMHWSVTTTGCCHHCWVQRALITSPIRTPTHRRGWCSGEASWKPWCSLSPMSSTTSTDMLSKIITLLISVSMNVPSSHLPIGNSLAQASHPIINVTCSSHGLDGSPQSLVAPWPSGFSFLLHASVHSSSVPYLHSVSSHFYLCSSPSLITWTPQAEFNIICISIRNPLFVQAPSKKQDCLPWCQDHSFGDLISWTGFLQHISNLPSIACVGRGWLVTLPSPRFTLTWMQ